MSRLELTDNGDTEPRESVKKRIMIVNRRVPHGSIYPQESLDVALMGSAFEQDLSLVFLDDGVFVLKSEQQPASIGIKNFAKAWRALPDYDIDKVFVEHESLIERQLSSQDLVMAVEVVSRQTLMALMDEQDVLLEF